MKYHPQSLISEMANRLPDAERDEPREMVYSMVGHEIKAEGSKTYRKIS